MNRIDKLFSVKQKDVLAVYFTAGYPNGENACDVTLQLANAGVDLVEIGMPFSDPLADGPVIQESSMIALQNGMTLHRLFSELVKLRSRTEVPVVLMGYLNPVLQFGMRNFIRSCSQCGVDGIILPDLPIEEFVQYQSIFQEFDVYPVFLVSPALPAERISKIAAMSKGFVYVVSSSSITGTQNTFAADQKIKLESALKSINDCPAVVGFGIYDGASFRAMTQFANGGVVGSAFIRELKDSDVESAVARLIKKIKTTSHDYSTV